MFKKIKVILKIIGRLLFLFVTYLNDNAIENEEKRFDEYNTLYLEYKKNEKEEFFMPLADYVNKKLILAEKYKKAEARLDKAVEKSTKIFALKLKMVSMRNRMKNMQILFVE